MKHFVLACLALLGFSMEKPALSAPLVAPPFAGPSPRLIAELRPEKTTFLLGDPILLSFVVRNPDDRNRLFIDGGDYWSRQNFKVETRDKSGNPVIQPKYETGMLFIGSFGANKIPTRGEFAFSLFLPHWATFSRPGHYRITAKRTLALPLQGKTIFDAFRDKNSYATVPLQASAEVEVLPPDAKKLGALIQNWGESMLASSARSDGDGEKLRSLSDARAVPFLIRAAEKLAPDDLAINALSHFGDGPALEELEKLATRKRTKDKRPYPPGLMAPDPDALRLSAVQSIAQFRTARRTEFLLSLRRDPYDNIRLVVVQSIDGLPEARARTVWREMARDASSIVRQEAQSRLELRKPKRNRI